MSTRPLSSIISSNKRGSIPKFVEAVRVELASTRDIRPTRRSTPFIRGPLPMPWVSRAAHLPGRALHVALLLWFRVGCEGVLTVRLRRQHQLIFGLNRHAAYRGLSALQHAGLVIVDRRRGRCPVVTLRSVDDETGS